MALMRDGSTAITALATGLHVLDLGTGAVELITDPEPDLPTNRLNDGKVDRRGRFVFGSMDTAEVERNGRLYRLDPNYELTVLDDELLVANGPCWSPDDSTFYFSDTFSGEIWAYDYDVETGAVSNRRTFATIEKSPIAGFDGSTVDAQGGVWNAVVFDGKVVRYAPDGAVDRVIEMPVKNITSVMFGGPGLDTLFVTSMAQPPHPRFPRDPGSAGSVFAITGLGVTGIPEPRFAGE
jgi:sugar lactone lactonase YvrE